MSADNFVLRDYQSECKNVIFNDNRNKLIKVATGGGKTLLFNHVSVDAVKSGARILIIVPSEEILAQVRNNLLELKSDLNISIIQGPKKELHGDVVIATRQTLTSRYSLSIGLMENLLSRGVFKYVIVDEVHEAPNQIRKIYEYNKDSIFLGFTATPYNVRLDDIFTDGISYNANIPFLISNNYLCKCTVKRKTTNSDISHVSCLSKSKSEYITHELEKKINNSSRNKLVVDEILKIYNERKSIIVYCAGIEHVKTITEMLKEYDLSVESIDSTIKSKHQRKEIIDRFRNNDTKILVNCNILTTGFDSPVTDCIVFAAPTKSKTRYVQRLGRGLRIYPGKKNCLLIEFVDANDYFDSINVSDIMNEELYTENYVKKSTNDIKFDFNKDSYIYKDKNFYNYNSYNYNKSYDLESYIEINNGITNYNWIKESFGYVLFLNKKDALVIIKNIYNSFDIYLFTKDLATGIYSYPKLKVNNIDNLDGAKAACENYVLHNTIQLDMSLIDKDNPVCLTNSNLTKINFNIKKLKDALKYINYTSID